MTDIYKQLDKLSPEKRELLELMLKEKGIDLSKQEIVKQSRETDKFPLSFGQQRLWFLDQFEPGSPLYNNPAAVVLTGPLNVKALEQSLNEIIRRHEVLRTTFASQDEQPVQIINAEMPLVLEKQDLRDLPESDRETEAMKIAVEQAQQPFDLTKGPLFQAKLLQIEDEKHWVVLIMHHAVSDAWSLGVLVQEVAALYEAFSTGRSSPLSELAIQYADYAYWQRNYLQGKELDKQLSYWTEQLKDSPPVLNLPTDFPRPKVQSSNGRIHRFKLPDHLAQSLRELSKKEDVTLFMVLLSALQTLLYRYSGQDDLCVGTPIAGRNRAETEALIGFFINTLVMRTDLSDNPTFRELLRRVKEVALEAYAHQDMPFETLVEKLQPERDMSRSPFFQVMFVHQNAPMQELKLPNIKFEFKPIDDGTAKFDLTLEIEEIEHGLRGAFVYNTDLFKPETIERMEAHFLNLLAGIVANPAERISALPLLSETERTILLEQWSQPITDGFVIQDKTIAQLFEAQVEKTPDSIAVVYENEQLSYRALNRRANQLAYHLKELGVGPEVLVGVYMEQPIDMIVALVGIFKSGGTYLPLDPAYPEKRLVLMIQDSNVPVLLSQSKLLESLPKNKAQIVCMDTDADDISRQSVENPQSCLNADNLAYVIYTSGSTGKPKGVLIQHGSIANHTLFMKDYYHLTDNDRVLQFASLNFDASLEQILTPLISGATLVLRGAEIWSPSEFQKKLADYQLTVINPPTAYWNQLVQAWDDSYRLDSIEQPRLVIVGGDLLSVDSLNQWQNTSIRSSTLLNAYGPTETTITSTIFDIPEDINGAAFSNGAPIGKPLALRSIYILDQWGNPVPVGVFGELHIGGLCVARGYLNRPDLTAERFIPDQFSKELGARLYRTGDLVRFRADGNIEFLGRVDHQVKVRGYRVELGEIETVLNRHDAIKEGVVVLREDEPGDKRLVAYLATNGAFDSVELRNDLRQQLPDYMIPSIFVPMDELPRTPIGKIDRKALPVPEQDRPDLARQYVAPTNPVEQMIADLWAEVLNVERVGIHDNFFDLGGHSLMATQIITRLRNSFHVDIPLRKLFESPTVATLAMVIAEAQAEQVDEEELSNMLDELEGLSEEEVEKLLVD